MISYLDNFCEKRGHNFIFFGRLGILLLLWFLLFCCRCFEYSFEPSLWLPIVPGIMSHLVTVKKFYFLCIKLLTLWLLLFLLWREGFLELLCLGCKGKVPFLNTISFALNSAFFFQIVMPNVTFLSFNQYDLGSYLRE